MSQFKPYPAYKDSGVEWLGEVPEHWVDRKIVRDIPFVVSWTVAISFMFGGRIQKIS